MRARHISIDIETLSLHRNALILSIALVSDTGDEVHVFPDLNEQIRHGRSFDGDTLLWWMGQNSENLQEQGTADRTKNFATLDLLAEFFNSNLCQETLIWGNSPSFDCEILGDFMGGKIWKFWQERDVRTARMIVGRTKPHQGHSALHDARAQLQDALVFMNIVHAEDQG